WPELTQIFDWTQTNVHDTFNICWAGQAALYHFRGVNKRELPKKRFGLFEHYIVTPNSVLLRGFPDDFPVPVSRYTEVCEEEIPDDPSLRILAASPEAGVCLIRDHRHGQVYMFNHLEYDTGSLGDEYRRDKAAGEITALPVNYFPNDDPKQPPRNQWRGLGHLLVGNWINDLYQSTPYDIDHIRTGPP
ncbi:MAG: homoserine O-succinyltransferase, partial [Alphaproteobacteria bacterium]|nr:homoserine O-succinyltransferase [Alphaproteobacteria bacterium]